MENKTGFVASSFDILHPGYVMMLKECKDNCSYLIVGLHENPSWGRHNKNSPIMSLHERFLVLKSIRYIDVINRFHSYSSSSLRKEIYEAEKRKVDLENFKREEVLV